MINEFVDAGHFYSVIPKITADYNVTEPLFSGLDFNDANHIAILDEISGYLTKFDDAFGASNAADRQKQHQYTLPNGAFEWMDARMLHYFIQKNARIKSSKSAQGIRH